MKIPTCERCGGFGGVRDHDGVNLCGDCRVDILLMDTIETDQPAEPEVES